jgi:replication-associated recombination protein RarA
MKTHTLMHVHNMQYAHAYEEGQENDYRYEGEYQRKRINIFECELQRKRIYIFKCEYQRKYECEYHRK